MEMIITTEQIRKSLKKYDGWFFKVSTTRALLDRTYDMVPIHELKSKIDYARSEYADMIYRESVFDCENFALRLQSNMQKYWAQDITKKFEPAVFRVVVDEDPPHSINLVFTDSGMRFIEPQTGEVWWNDKTKIIAVT